MLIIIEMDTFFALVDEWCRRRGYGGVTEACIREGLASDNPDIVRKANFARNARKWGR